jgi:chemotaxis protein CheC
MLSTTSAARLQPLTRLLTAATEEASTAMYRWTAGQFTLSMEQACELPWEHVCDHFGLGEEPRTTVAMRLESPWAGDLILMFDDLNGRQMAASLLGQEVAADEPWSDLERSALTETGNIVGCAYLNAITRLLGTELVPTPPVFIEDFGASVLGQAVVAHAMQSERVFVCQTWFHRDGATLDARLFFLPSQELRQRIMAALSSR